MYGRGSDTVNAMVGGHKPLNTSTPVLHASYSDGDVLRSAHFPHTFPLTSLRSSPMFIRYLELAMSPRCSWCTSNPFIVLAMIKVSLNFPGVVLGVCVDLRFNHV